MSNEAKPGRVYGLPDEPDARSGMGYRFFTPKGVKVPLLVRVAFDADADEGMATVTGYARDADGTPIVDAERGEACRVTFRTWLLAVPPGAPDPVPTPTAQLIKRPDGSIVRLAEDPFPSVPVEPRR